MIQEHFKSKHNNLVNPCLKISLRQSWNALKAMHAM